MTFELVEYGVTKTVGFEKYLFRAVLQAPDGTLRYAARKWPRRRRFPTLDQAKEAIEGLKLHTEPLLHYQQ